MKTSKVLTITLIAAALTASTALAGGRGGSGSRARTTRSTTTQICPNGNVPGSRQGANQPGVGNTRRADGNPNSTGTPLRDGSGKATAPGNGAKDGTGNNPRHPVTPPAE